MQILKTKDDFYTSVERALDEIDGDWRKYKGLIVVGSHFPSEIDEKLLAIKEAREKNIPFLGICLGMQLAIIEFARNVLNQKTATSQEIGKGKYFIKKLKELRVGIKKVQTNYGDLFESHWHNYAVNNDFVGELSDGGVSFTGWSEDGIAEEFELKGHKHFKGVQYHPEYQSLEDSPHRILKDFIKACRK